MVDCTICWDSTDKPIALHSQVEGDSYVVCEDSAKTSVSDLFLKALKYEHDYPPCFGNVYLELAQFTRFLPGGFKEHYVAREEEYQTPKRKRIYCKHPRTKYAGVEGAYASDDQGWLDPTAKGIVEECGHYFGVREEYHQSTPVRCKQCPGHPSTCMHCGEATRRSLVHDCAEVRRANDNDKAFDGLIRGKHYHICPDPDCRIRVELSEACNQMHAEHDSDHWSVGHKCPRFNQPGSANAIYDGFGDEFQDEVIEGADDEREDEETFEEELVDWATLNATTGRELRILAEREEWRARRENHGFVLDEDRLTEAYEIWSERAANRDVDNLEQTREDLKNIWALLFRTFEHRAIYPAVGMHLNAEELALILGEVINFIEIFARWEVWLKELKIPRQAIRITSSHISKLEDFRGDLEARLGEDLTIDVATIIHTSNLSGLTGPRARRHALVALQFFYDKAQKYLHGFEFLSETRKGRMIVYLLTAAMIKGLHFINFDITRASITELCRWALKMEENEEEVDVQRANVIACKNARDEELAKAKNWWSLPRGSDMEEDEEPDPEEDDSKEVDFEAVTMAMAIEEYDTFAVVVKSLIPKLTLRYFKRGWLN